MKIATTVFFCLLAVAPEADPRHFGFVRDVQIQDASRQNFIVVDADAFAHTRDDLADLRLYDGDRQVPYKLTESRAGSLREEREVRILNLAAVGDHTEFDVDMQGVAEYDNLRLRLNAKDFVVRASVEGRDALTGGKAAPWPTPSTLYDFSAEKLGSNFNIKLPTWSFRYVHVKLGRVITPEQVLGASVSNLQEKRAAYISVGSCKSIGTQPHETRWSCSLAPKAPLDRIVFDVPPLEINFRRPVSVRDEHDVQVASGEISRIRTRRGGTDIVAENLAVRIGAVYGPHMTVVIENGDDASLGVTAVQPQSFQRRIYFDAAGRSTLRLYFGDAKLEAPVYDYAKMFQEAEDAAPATLGAMMTNSAFVARADDRPWSERHPALLWTAMVAAIIVLAGLAIRGLANQRA